MAYEKLQGRRALKFTPDDAYNIPNISSVLASGTTTSATANKLVDTNADFVNRYPSVVGSVVFNTTDNTFALVTAVDDANTLSLDADIMASGESYSLHPQEENGCVLYVSDGAGTGNSMNVTVITCGGDEVLFEYVNSGSFLPIQVLAVKATGTSAAASVVAIW
jgi:hypothetical protein